MCACAVTSSLTGPDESVSILPGGLSSSFKEGLLVDQPPVSSTDTKDHLSQYDIYLLHIGLKFLP